MFYEPQEGKVIIYGTSYCPYCKKAEQLLTQKHIPFTKIDVDDSANDRLRLKELSFGRTTVPQIFFGKDHVGGYDDLDRLLKNGELLSRLHQNNLCLSL